jgi:betaine-aldehyde dehydrogenase
MTPVERAPNLTPMAEGLRARSPELAECRKQQDGENFSLAGQVGQFGAMTMDGYAAMADSFAWIERHDRYAPRKAGMLVREPVGVVAAIVRGNAPLISFDVKLAPALLAGCTAVVKSAPTTPLDGYLLAEITVEAGLPAGVVNTVAADRDASEHLVRNPDIDKVSFHGSLAVGRQIATIMGDRIGRYALELGGKSPAIVLDDYPVDEVAQSMATRNACQAAGQACASLTRVLVSRKRHDELVEALVAHYARVCVGDPYDVATEMGPLAMERQFNRVRDYVAKGKAEGAVLAIGGDRPAHLDRGYFIAPTVFGNVSNSMTIAQEEIFGPVTSVIPYDTLDQAIEIANDTIYGLGGCVFTNDDDAAYRVARSIRTGTVSQNDFDSDFNIAFGGFKQSGVGREGGVEGLMEFLETKTLLLNSYPQV